MNVDEMIDILTTKRLALKLPQEELARTCDMQQNTLAKIENHQGSPQFKTLYKIAENLGYEIVLVEKSRNDQK